MAAGAGAPDDIVTQVIWRGVTARILAGRGQAGEEAEELAAHAVALVAPTNSPSYRGETSSTSPTYCGRIPAPMRITTRLKPLWLCTNRRAT